MFVSDNHKIIKNMQNSNEQEQSCSFFYLKSEYKKFNVHIIKVIVTKNCRNIYNKSEGNGCVWKMAGRRTTWQTS